MLDNQLVSKNLKTTSLVIADRFGKRHTEVLRSIRNLEIPKDFSQRNFASAEYTDVQGKPRAMFEITKDGFMLLAMGFTGKEAMQWKIKFIEAFNMMESMLNNGLSPAQQRAIQEAVSLRVSWYPKREQPSGYKRIYGKLKEKYKVGSYKDIPGIYFESALALIHSGPAPRHFAKSVPADDLLLTAEFHLKRGDDHSREIGLECLAREIENRKQNQNILNCLAIAFQEAGSKLN